AESCQTGHQVRRPARAGGPAVRQTAAFRIDTNAGGAGLVQRVQQQHDRAVPAVLRPDVLEPDVDHGSADRQNQRAARLLTRPPLRRETARAIEARAASLLPSAPYVLRL